MILRVGISIGLMVLVLTVLQGCTRKTSTEIEVKVGDHVTVSRYWPVCDKLEEIRQTKKDLRGFAHEYAMSSTQQINPCPTPVPGRILKIKDIKSISGEGLFFLVSLPKGSTGWTTSDIWMK